MGNDSRTKLINKAEVDDLPLEREHWFKSHWRPAAAWTYLGICIFDFVAAPIFFGWFGWFTGSGMKEWTPLTIQGGAIFHLSFGAIIGIYAWNRTREKIEGVESDVQIVPPTPPVPPVGPPVTDDTPTNDSGGEVLETKPPKKKEG